MIKNIKYILKLIVVFSFILQLTSCASTNNQDTLDDEINSEIYAEENDIESGSEDIEAAEDESFDSEEFADNESGDEEFDSEEFAEDDEVASSQSDAEDIESELDDELSASESEEQLAQNENLNDDELLESELDEPNKLTEEVDQVAENLEPTVPQEEPVEVAEESFPDSEELPVNDSFTAKTQIKNIRFVSNKNGGSVLIDAQGPVEFRKRMNLETQQLVVEVPNAELPKSLKYPYIMKEFPSAPFASINAYQSANSNTARIVIQLKPSVGEPLVAQEGNSIVVLPYGSTNIAQNESEIPAKGIPADNKEYVTSLAGNKVLSAKSLENFLMSNNTFYGKPISLNMSGTDIRDAITFIAEYSGANIIVTDEVKGKVSLKLRDVPWDQAFVTILRSKSLGYVRLGNVLRVSSVQKLKREADLARDLRKTQESLRAFKVKVFPVSYSNVDDLAAQVKGFLSSKGSALKDSRTSSLIVTDTEDVLQKVQLLIKELDVAPRQVLIEAKVVEATETFTRSMGVNWNFGGAVTLSDSGGANGGPLELGTDVAIAPVSSQVLAGMPGQISMTLGTLDFLGDLGATLALAETNGTAKVVSSPRILAMNREKANIAQQSQVVAITSKSDGSILTTTIERTPVTLSLEVTPQITAVGSVIMGFEIKREFAGPEVDPTTKARAVNTRTAKSKVLVESGQTAVIGGIYQTTSNQGETGVPMMKDIPILGWLFKSKSRQKEKNELLMFLKPRIINDKTNI